MPTYFEKYGHTFITLAAIVTAFLGLATLNSNRFDAQDKLISQHFEAVNQRFDAVNQRFDAQDKYINQRFDAQDKRLDSLTNEVSELHKLTVGISERVSRSEGEIDVIRQQLQTADKPSP